MCIRKYDPTRFLPCAHHVLRSSIIVSAIIAISWQTPSTESGLPEGITQYTTCDNLLNTSGGDWPNSAVFEIAASGVELNKLVIGKPAQAAGNANNGYVAPETLATCLSEAKAKGWSAYHRYLSLMASR